MAFSMPEGFTGGRGGKPFNRANSDQPRHYHNLTLATSRQGRIISCPDAPDPFFDHAPKRVKLSDDGHT
jgi:hypothetical protein